MNKLRIAISQFPVTENVEQNERYIIRHIGLAKRDSADVIQFPETALTGYETPTDNLNWSQVEKSLDKIRKASQEVSMYVVLGSHYRSTKEKPHNCLYVISSKGLITGKYCKNYLYKKERDRFHAARGILVTNIKGVSCGFAICYDSCFPRLFETYMEKGIKVLFLSYYNAGSRRGKNSLDTLMKAQLITRAADNGMYIAASNSSKKHSRLPASFARPDGSIESLRRHKTGILVVDYPGTSLGWTYYNRVD